MSSAPRLGVVGAGSLGYHHVRLLREICGQSFAGFHESRADRAAQVATELGVRGYESLDALLDEVEAVTIAVPTSHHFAVAKEALGRGKHVLIEKPLTTTIAEADGLLSIAARTGALVQTGHVERFNRSVRAALPYVDEPRFVQSDRLAPFSIRGADVAVVLDLMIHDIDLLLTLIGQGVESVSAVGVPVLTPTVDIANARLGFTSGAVATITASRVSRERLRKIRIFQRSGYLSLDLAAGTGEFFRLREGLDVTALMLSAASGSGGSPAGPLALESFVERVALEAPDGEPLRLELQSFVSAVKGESPVVVTGEDGRRALEVALRIVTEIERAMPALRGAALPR